MMILSYDANIANDFPFLRKKDIMPHWSLPKREVWKSANGWFGILNVYLRHLWQ
jgi:hypothetical protein